MACYRVKFTYLPFTQETWRCYLLTGGQLHVALKPKIHNRCHKYRHYIMPWVSLDHSKSTSTDTVYYYTCREVCLYCRIFEPQSSKPFLFPCAYFETCPSDLSWYPAFNILKLFSPSRLDNPLVGLGLLWTNDRPVAETSSWQHTILAGVTHLCRRRGSNPQPQWVKGRRTMP